MDEVVTFRKLFENISDDAKDKQIIKELELKFRMDAFGLMLTCVAHEGIKEHDFIRDPVDASIKALDRLKAHFDSWHSERVETVKKIGAS